MEENVDATSADSSPAPAESADPSQATTQPVPAAPAQPEVPFHQHPRWIERQKEITNLRSQVQQLLAREQQRQQASQAAPSDPLTPEEEAAAKALHRIMSKDPRFAAALMAGQNFPKVQESLQGFTQMQQQQAQAHNHAARSFIKEMVSTANLPTDKESLDNITALVARTALSIENGDERFKAGDMSVLEEAFQKTLPWFSNLRKPAETNLIATKNKLKTLPKPVQGSAAGQPAMPKLNRDKGTQGEREYEQGLASMAKRLLSEG